MSDPTENLSGSWLRPNRRKHHVGKYVEERDGNDHSDDEAPLVFHQDEFSSANVKADPRLTWRRGSIADLMIELASRDCSTAGHASVSSVLCVPSMHGNQKGFKSPVYRMKTKKGLSEANCGRATDRGKEG